MLPPGFEMLKSLALARSPFSIKTFAEKVAIDATSHVEGETVCNVARRHYLTPQRLLTLPGPQCV